MSTRLSTEPRPPRTRIVPASRTRWWRSRLMVAAAIAAAIALMLGIVVDRVVLPTLATRGLSQEGKLLPSRIQQSRVIRVASHIAYPGVEAFSPDRRQVQGIDSDLCNALGQRFGNVRCEFTNLATVGLIPGLLSGRQDIIMSGLGDSTSREQQIDMIDYYSFALAMLVPKANVAKIGVPTDLCGKSVSVQFALQREYVSDLSARCKVINKPEVKAVPADLSLLEAGKVDAAIADYPTAVQVVALQPGLAFAGRRLVQYPQTTQKIVAPWGIGVRKDDGDLSKALVAALSAMIADGTYDRILARWGAAGGALRTVQVNCSSNGTCPAGVG